MIFVFFVVLNKKTMKRTLLFFALLSVNLFAQENPNLIEFSIDESFDYQYSEKLVKYDVLEQFYNENKTTNPKVEIPNENLPNKSDIFDYQILYDNENNAYLFSMDFSADIGIPAYSLKEYNQDNQSWKDLGSSSLNSYSDIYEGGLVGIFLIGKNSEGKYFIVTYPSSLLSFSFNYDILVLNTVTNEWKEIYNNGSLDINSNQSLHFINNCFYQVGSGIATIKDTNGNDVTDHFARVDKSTDTKTLSTEEITIQEKNNLEFINGQFVSEDVKILKVLTITGKSIPNENLSTNSLYIVITIDDKGNTFTSKVLAM